MNTLPKLIIILGSTTTGKTKLAVKLASIFNGEIVSADSRQVYKEMNIGTGKDINDYLITQKHRKHKNTKSSVIVPHHLINIISLDADFNVAKFKKLALKAITDIHKRGKIPFLVGGTGLYISSIVDNYDIPKIKPDKKIRESLKTLKSLNKIKTLRQLDPRALYFVDIKNPRRLDRALEVCLSGYKFSEVRQKKEPEFDILQIGITFPKNILNKRIDARVDKMIKNGLIEETKKIIKKYGKNINALNTIGYQEIVEYLDKKTTLPEAAKLIKIHTRQFAKRQMTWFKRDKKIKWIKNYSESKKIIRSFLKQWRL